MIRTPFRHVAGHLLWSTTGRVWAVWKVTPLPGGYLPARVHQELLGRVTSLVRSMPGMDPRLFVLAARTDPGEVAERMVADVDWRRLPEWAETCAAAVDLLADREMHERTLWLAVPVASNGSTAAASLTALYSELSANLNLAPIPVPEADVTAAFEDADRIQSSLGGGLGLRSASPAEIVWMLQHAVHRGLSQEPLLSDAEHSPLYGSRVHAGRLQSPSYADLGDIRVAEGGQEAREEKATKAVGKRPWWRSAATSSPLGRRWLQVESEAGTGYQSHLVLAELPPAVSVEAADILAQLEGLPFPIDVTVDLRVVPSKKARAQVQRKKRELLDQADQYGAQPTGMPHSLPDAAGDLAEEDARMARTSVEVEVQSVTVLTVWAGDAATCDARARELSAALSGGDYRVVRPYGMQEDLFALSLPGAARAAQLLQFTQHQLSEDWAAAGALTLSRVGDPAGIMIGHDLDSGTIRPVLINPADAPQVNASASSAVCGDLGGGKSVLAKQVTAGVVDRGGRAIVIDRTPIREWATFARSSMGERCQIIDAAQAHISIDPLRVFGGAIGAHYALSYLTLQLGVGAMTAAGAVLHHAVEEVSGGPDPSMGKVLDVLAALAMTGGSSRADAAATMADLLRIVRGNPLAAMVFDPDLPPVTLDGDMGADMVVVTTAGLTLPPKEAFANAEILRQQPLEALIGRAVLYLIAAIARQAAFTDPDRFCLVTLDEVYWLTSSAEGAALIHEILHDGRKHGAGVFMGAHDEQELGKDAGLIAYRYLSRTTDSARAARGLKFLGLDGEDEDLIRLVTTGLSPVGQVGREGEMLLRDPRMQIGRIKVIVPGVPRIKDAIYTTPGRKTPPVARGRTL